MYICIHLELFFISLALNYILINFNILGDGIKRVYTQSMKGRCSHHHGMAYICAFTFK